MQEEVSQMSNCTNDNDLQRRKRRRTSESVGLRHQIYTNPQNLGLRHETQSPNKGSNPVDFPCNCHIDGHGQNNILPKLQFKEPSNMVNYDQKQRQIISMRNSGDDESTNFDHFFTELDDALSRIESLIPSLQQMVCSNHPTNRDSCVGVSSLLDLSRLDPRHHLSNTIARFEECKCSIDCKQINEMLRKCSNLVPLPERDETKLSNMIDKPLNCVSTRSKSPTSLFSNLDSKKGLPGRRNQIREAKNRAGMDRVEAVKYTLCRNGSVKSQVPDHIQGSQIMPCLFKNNNMNQNQMMYKESNVTNGALRPQARDPLIGSANIVRPKRVSNYELSQCLTEGSTSLDKSRSSKRISFRDRDDRSKKIMMLSDSYSSSSETYRSTSSGSDGSYESEVQSRRRDWSSGRKQIEASDSTLGYDTSSYCKSQDSYSDAVSSSQSRPSWSQDHDLKQNKRGGRFKRFKKKLGMIFHHHHHHHYRRRDESDVGLGGSFWKHIGKMFHQKRKSDREKPKSDKSKKSVIKGASNPKQGHFGGLVQALVKHMRQSKKSKKAKDNFVRSGNSQHNKRNVNKLPWLPKIHKGKGGLKVYNKGKLKLKNGKKRFPLIAAKMILQEQ